MSTAIRPASYDDIGAVCDLLYENMSQKISRERWRNLLDYAWRPADSDRGRVAVDGDRIIGFLGLVYSDRPVGSRVQRFCNLSAWYLLRAYRGRGIGQALLSDAVAEPTLTYTNLTATAAAAQAFKRAGFEVLDEARFLFRRQARTAGRGELEQVVCGDVPDGRLSPEQHRIWQDHRGCNLRHLVFRARSEQCYLVLSVKKKGADLSYHEVMYASNLPLLATYAQALANAMLTREDEVLAVDRRFLAKVSAEGALENIRLPRLYRSPDLAPGQIDHLYSEVVLLDLKLP